MERLPRVVYTPEFREQAVRLHEVDGLTVPEVANRLSMSQGTLKNRIYASRQGNLEPLRLGSKVFIGVVSRAHHDHAAMCRRPS